MAGTKEGCELDADVFPFWEQQDKLRNHWYPLAFTCDLKPNQLVRQIALGIPVVLWPTADGSTRGFVDVCPHRQAQLSLGTANASGLSCPYHGWRFGQNGNCNHIPIAPSDRLPRAAPQLTRIPLCEDAGMIWAWMGQGSPAPKPPLFETNTSGWMHRRAKRVFPFDLDDVIENFMDFAHTPVVHPGLIRGILNAETRQATIEVSTASVRSVHDPVDEKVGILSRLVVPPGKVHHSDTFMIPGNVQVEYGFGSASPSFVAKLGMTPVGKNQTLVLVTLATKLGWANPVVGLALPWLVRKVLAQDALILAQQRVNLNLISLRKRRSLESDSVDSLVRAMRANARDPSLPRPKAGTRTISVHL